MKTMPALLYALVLWLGCGFAAQGGDLLRCDYDADAAIAGWSATEGAAVAPFGRSGRSLVIASTKADKGTAAWTSPDFAVTGPMLSISGWMAENYTAILGGDDEQLAAVKIQFLNAAGAPIGEPTKAFYSDYRIADVLNGAWIEPDGLRWCYRSATIAVAPTAATARVSFYFPRNTTKGRVFLDDLCVALAPLPAASAESASPAISGATWGDTMLVNTPAPDNIFTVAEPLRFDLAFWGAPGADKAPRKAAIPEGAVIQWTITDFLEERLAAGTVLASTRAAFAKYNKGQCELLSIPVSDEIKSCNGTLLYFEAKLMDGPAILATDAGSFMVTDPRPAQTPEEMANSHFTGGCGDRIGVTHDNGPDWSLSTWLDRQTPPESVITVPHPASRRPRQLYLLYAQCSQTGVGNTAEKKVYCGFPQWMLTPWDEASKALATPTTPNQLDWDAFGRFVGAMTRAYAKEYHLTIVDPAASERVYTELAHRMQMTGYAAIKAVNPDIPVGLSTFGAFGNDDVIETFFQKNAFDYCDVVDDHIYCGSHTVRAMATRIDKLYHRLEKMGKKKRFVTTEMAAVGTLDHEAKAADQIQMIADLMAAHLTYFNCFYAGSWPTPNSKAALREWPRTGEQFEQFMFQDWLNGPKIVAGAETVAARRDMPLLRMTAMYNLQRFLGWSTYRQTLPTDEATRVHAFEQDGHTIMVGYRLPSHGDRLVHLKAPGAKRIAVVDNFGRETTATIDGNAGVVLALHEVPAFWIFDATIEAPSLTPLTGAFVPAGTFLPGAVSAAFRVTECPADWTGATAQVRMGKPYVAPKPSPVTVAKGAAVEVTWTFDVPAGAPLRVGPMLRIERDGTALALVDAVWKQEPPVTITVDTEPVIPGREAAVRMTVRNKGASDWNGTVEVSNPYFAAPGQAPQAYRQTLSVKGLSTGTGRCVVEHAGAIAVNQVYPVTVRVTSGTGTRSWQQNLSFLACRKRVQPITIDGALDDWDLKTLAPQPFPRLLMKGWAYKGPGDCAAVCYTRWDEKNLYIAYDVTDDVWYNPAADTQIYDGDCIMQSLLPGTVEPGTLRNLQPTRIHLGLNAGEKTIIDLQDVGSTSLAVDNGMRLAITRKNGHVIYEMAYAFDALGTLRAVSGAKFRMSDWIFDIDAPNTGLRGLSMFPFVSHVDRNPDFWADWIMTD